MSKPRIVVIFEHPPIPTRSFDWVAYRDGNEEGARGWGATEAAAIADLKATEECDDALMED